MTAPMPDAVTVCDCGCGDEVDAFAAGLHLADEDSWKVIAGRTLAPGCWFHAECHEENLPATERADCSHLRICKGCAEEHFCLDCEREDFWWESVDRAYEAAKGGDYD